MLIIGCKLKTKTKNKILSPLTYLNIDLKNVNNVLNKFLGGVSSRSRLSVG